MPTQSTLSTFQHSIAHPFLDGPYTCATCRLQRGFQKIGQELMVRCGTSGLRKIPDGCGGWGGKGEFDLSGFARPEEM